MLPSIHILGFHVPMYSLMMVLGVVAFVTYYFVVVEKKEGIERVSSNRMLFVSAVGFAVLGLSAYIFNSIFHSIESGKLVIGGITWLGGVVGAFPFMIFIIHKFVPQAKGDALYYFSLIVPGIVLGHAFGRVGCFFAGCCYGKVTDSVFGISFPAGSAAARLYPGEGGGSLPVLPTQLFEAIFELTLFLVLIIFRKKLKKYSVEIYLIAYGIFRFIMEFFRGDDRGTTGFFLTPSQFMCILLLVAAVMLILYRNKIVFKRLSEKCLVWQQEAAVAVQNVTKNSSKKQQREEVSLSTLRELHDLKESGIISEEEYEQKKKDILRRL